MKKSTWIVIAVLAALGVAVAVLLVLNRGDMEARQQQLEDGVLLIIHEGITHEITIEDIQTLGPREFDANYNRSGRPAENRVFTGVRFSQVLEFLEIDAANASSVIFAAADGYTSAISAHDALHAAYLALCDEFGPFRMVLPRDPVSQRWVHWLTEVEFR